MTMSQPSSNGLHQRVYATLGEYLRRDPAALHPEDTLRDDLGLDSLQTIELVYEVESAFDLQIPDEDFGRLQTIGDVVLYLSERTSSSHNEIRSAHILQQPPTNNHHSGVNSSRPSTSRSKSES